MNSRLQGIARWLRPGDFLVLVCAAAFTVALFPLLWRGGHATRAEIRRGGELVARLPLDAPRQISVQGPLGTTRIEIQPGRARVAQDPGPRQYCVLQGWLSRPGAVAICAPNHVTLQLAGDQATYDTLTY
ncbi:MAG: NusG domain II-containing protein [Rhodocyclaceae bacterium]|nr:NusG domain II-containing protein [Rhodocyclaceae bacterium]